MKKKKTKPNILEQTYKKNKLWNDIYYIENKIIDIIKNIYFGKIVNRYQIYDLIAINIQFNIFSKTYECMLSKRGNNYGFSIYNIEEPFKFSDDNNKFLSPVLNQTIENNKYYLYNIYKIIFKVLQKS